MLCDCFSKVSISSQVTEVENVRNHIIDCLKKYGINEDIKYSSYNRNFNFKNYLNKDEIKFINERFFQFLDHAIFEVNITNSSIISNEKSYFIRISRNWDIEHGPHNGYFNFFRLRNFLSIINMALHCGDDPKRKRKFFRRFNYYPEKITTECREYKMFLTYMLSKGKSISNFHCIFIKQNLKNIQTQVIDELKSLILESILDIISNMSVFLTFNEAYTSIPPYNAKCNSL